VSGELFDGILRIGAEAALDRCWRGWLDDYVYEIAGVLDFVHVRARGPLHLCTCITYMYVIGGTERVAHHTTGALPQTGPKMKKTVLALAKADLLNKTAQPSNELVDAVSDGNGRAFKFVYNAAEVVQLALRAERRLERSGLPQADRVGFEATFSHAGPDAKAYKYTATGRSVSLRRTAKGWVLVSIDEISVYPAQDERVTYRASPQQIAEMQRRAVLDLIPLAA
jgi:hypothetical protein